MNNSSIPFQNEKVKLHVHNSLGYILDPEKGKIKVLNETGVDIWNAIDGSTSVQRLIHYIGDLYEDKSYSFKTEVIEFLLQLKDRSLIYLKEE